MCVNDGEQVFVIYVILHVLCMLHDLQDLIDMYRMCGLFLVSLGNTHTHTHLDPSHTPRHQGCKCVHSKKQTQMTVVKHGR